MNTVFVPGVDAAETMELVRELRAKGLVQGPDFSFAYQRATHDPISFHIITNRGCEFTFTDAKWATYFRLKYNGAV